MILPGSKCIFTLLFLGSLIYSKGQAVNSNKASAHVFVSGPSSLYKTDDNKISINNIRDLYAQGRFKPINQAVLNAGIPKQYYWIHFNITNTLNIT
ncbi:7TM-DISM domain-containing protein, partial [Streptomyces lancefieldiae]|uniref:7TM-DISM domain-containing protein n=1 Tax=Streptomyces lancefieldiae TaxID=3075520 RepID=UPI00374E1520